jgi:hypothetical protein
MQTKQRGRPRQFDGREQVHLTEAERVHLRELAEREDRSVSAVCRQLIREALAARESQPRKRNGKQAA